LAKLLRNSIHAVNVVSTRNDNQSQIRGRDMNVERYTTIGSYKVDITYCKEEDASAQFVIARTVNFVCNYLL
jgi:hypothetical protein